MNIPENLKYSKDHEWSDTNNDVAVIGLTDFAQSELGDIIFIEFPDIGDQIFIGDTIGTVEAVKTVADMFSPLSGEIVEVNENLEDAPDLVNSDPYGEGWIIKIKLNKPKELDLLLDSKSYETLIK
ncbi:MAG: glycine cleavage system protein GcvH [Candidatus Marinimicrobia bacterium]|nr:glycine cleavage system protein GcvH [Candidatus Neomarinimicrobiota bacterium]MBL7023043.1 glycine cleavage system protein GcvH [Candidatus Neomarinimicrobiota bacterium]MBL7110144.1 glycine cleavage system protein GcvH [Candidatus Neomarinimicrobiota bacterium]